MAQSLSKRKRHVVLTVVLSTFFLIATVAAVWALSSPEETYRPGEDIEGLTASLARSLPADYPRVTFTDVSQQAGIHFQHFSGQRTSQLPEDMGSGAAWGDYDNDGWLDLYVVNEVGPITLSPDEVARSPIHNALYHNNGDGTFTEVSAQAGVDFRGWGMAAAWGDYDNDGWIDLLATAYGTNVLYKNNGDGTFSDISARSGFGEPDGFWTGASWADYNRDGLLDLYITGYVKYEPLDGQQGSLQYDVETPASINPSSFEPERNLLYRNNGNGTFTEVAELAGVVNEQGRSLSAAWADFDEDGWPDLYVANDVSDNVLYRNLGDGTFEEISHRALVADYRGAMGIAVGDWDGDADQDMFVTHWIAQENALYSNLRAQALKLQDPRLNAFQFMDEADRYGVGQIALDYIGWGTSFFDYNNDGRLDLFVANGSTFQQRETSHLLVPMQDQIFWNRGAEAGFYDVSVASGAYFQQEHVGRGAAFADYDNDGDMDVFVVNNDGPGVLLRNDGGNTKSWLKVALEGTQSNRQAIGARLRLVVGDEIQVRQIGAQASYCSQNSLLAHFGLDNATLVDTLEVTWPGGLQQTWTTLEANQVLHVQEGGEAL